MPPCWPPAPPSSSLRRAFLASPAFSLGHRARAYLAGRKRWAQPREAWPLGKPGRSFGHSCGHAASSGCPTVGGALPGGRARVGPLVSPPMAHLSSGLQGGTEERGGAEGCPLPPGTLYPSGVCSEAAGSQEAAGRQVPSPAGASCLLRQVGALRGAKLGWRLLSAGPNGARWE